MKKFFTHLFLLLFTSIGFAQINVKDSLVNVKTFWNVNDIKNYTFKTKEVKTLPDVTTQEEISYQVKITVESIFEDEITMLWIYDNVKFNSDKFVNNPLALIKQLPVRFVIDSDGRFLRYIELDKSVESFINSTEKLQNQVLDHPDRLTKINELAKSYATEENITKIFEKDIRQFHLFYGKGEFIPKVNSIEYNSYMDNLFSNSPTPAHTTITLNEIAFTGTNYIMNSYQEADKEWLANSWFTYLKTLAEKLETEQPDESHLKDEIIYNVTTNSRIKDNGWISYSLETKKVNFQDTNYTLERRIELE